MKRTKSELRAVLSDVHGNLEALRSVLDDVERRGVSDIYNLGDVTGYGPNPIECIDLSMSMSVVLRGSHDHAVLFETQGFSRIPEESHLWTKKLLKSPAEGVAMKRRLDFLASLSSKHREIDELYVHGSPLNPVMGWVFPEDVTVPGKFAQFGDQFERICFVGHTHVAGIFVENGPDQWEFVLPADCSAGFRLEGRKVICNVGSVGQPRDGDWRAGYVLFDGEAVQFVRVEYDIETTVRKIHQEAALDNFSGDRLREGQ